jgi:hypothetical protein
MKEKKTVGTYFKNYLKAKRVYQKKIRQRKENREDRRLGHLWQVPPEDYPRWTYNHLDYINRDSLAENTNVVKLKVTNYKTRLQS